MIYRALLWAALLLGGAGSALLTFTLLSRRHAHSFIARTRLSAQRPQLLTPAAPAQGRHLWLLPPALMATCILLTAWIHGDPVPWLEGLLWSLGSAAAFGLWRMAEGRRRRQGIARAFPDLVAHLSLQLEAGATPLQAFSSSLAAVHGPLGDELAVLVADLKLAPLDAALLRFAGRTGDADVWAFSQHVAQQQRSGMSLHAICAAEERHTLAMQQQRGRERISRAGAGLAAVLVVLVLNSAAMWALPMALELIRFLEPSQ